MGVRKERWKDGKDLSGVPYGDGIHVVNGRDDVDML